MLFRTFPLRRLLPVLVALALAAAAVVAVGCGGGGGGGSENADPAEIAPKGSLLYFSGYVRPQGDQKDAVESIAKKVLGVDDPGKRIQTLLDEGIKESDSKLNYEDDIKPWLGNRAAVTVTSFGSGGNDSQAAAIIDSKDSDKAKDTINKAADQNNPKLGTRKYEDVEYRYDPGDDTAAGVVDDFVVVGSEAGFKAVVDASKGSSLAESSQYKDAAKDADEKLAFGYIDTKALIGALSSSGQIPTGSQSLQTLLGAANQPVIMSLDASSDRLTFDALAGAQQGAEQAQQSTLLTELPGDSWLALGIANLGKAIRTSIDQLGGGVGAGLIQTANQQLKAATGLDLNRDILPSLGELAVFVRGSGVLTVGGGVVIKPANPAAARRVLNKLGPFIARQARGQVKVQRGSIAGARGLRFTSPNLPGSIDAVLKGDRLVIAYTDAATREALSPRQKLGDSPDFQQATSTLSGASPALYLAFAPLTELLSATNPDSASQIKQYLGAFANLVAGSKVEDNEQLGRFVVNLK